MKNGSAAAEGSLAVGDILMKIDGESLVNSKHKKAVKLLQKVQVEKSLNNIIAKYSKEILYYCNIAC